MKTLITKSILALAAGAALFATPAAHAGDRDRHDRDRGHADFFFRIDSRSRDCEPRRVWVEPVYEHRTTRVWVEPVYRTECVRVPLEGRYETRCDRVWVEPVYEYREVVRYHRGHRHCTRERVCVRPGHFRTVESRVWVPGGFRTEERQVLVTPGHFETRTDRVCVREGHWTAVGDDRPRERFTFGFNIGR
jgi:hypothetical protein